jgi:hypothetical protein
MPKDFPVPGGTVTVHEMGELSPRARRRIKPYAIALSDRMQQLAKASSITVDGKVAASSALPGPSTSMSLAEAELFTDMQDQTIIALLKSWTLPHPLPTTLDELLDVDDTTGQAGLYDALAEAVAKVSADAVIAAGFTLDSIEDPASPTGA